MWIVGSGRHEEAMNRMWTGETRRQAGSRSERTVIPADRPPKCVIKLQPLTNTLRCLKLDQEISKREDKRHSSTKKRKGSRQGKNQQRSSPKTSGRWGGPGRTLGKPANLGVTILCHCTSSGCDTRPAPSKAAVGEFSPCATLF